MSLSTRDVLRWLRSQASEDERAGLARFGIPSEAAFGIPMREMKRYARDLGTNHDLALALWEEDWYEARTIAVFIGDPTVLTAETMRAWAAGFDNWAICDTACFHLFDRSAHAWPMVHEWASEEFEFTKRAAFALLWGLTVHDKTSNNEPFIEALPLIASAAEDERTYVKKAVNMALRAIGKRNAELNRAACGQARSLAASTVPSTRWIGAHALRELESERVQARLG